MNRALVRRILYPLHERLRRRPTYDFVRRFRAADRMSREELATHHSELLASHVRHAVSEIPWWRDRFDAVGADPRDPASALERIPFLTKSIIRAELEHLVAPSMRDRVFQLATGGSSGEPLIFYTDNVREASQLAVKMRCREWWGIRTGDHQVDLWGSPIEIGANDRFREWKDRLLNFRLLSAFNLSDERMAGFRDVIGGADFVYGYASVLARYAAFLEARGEDLHAAGLKGAISTAEVLFDHQRELIERVYGCPVIDEYGCRDGGLIAHQCPEGSMHVAWDAVHVEIIDDDGNVLPPGEVGEIALTNLWSRGMPLIRYRLGDRGSLAAEPCACGRPHPVLASIAGRVTDTLVTPAGNRIHGLGVMYILRAHPGVARFQVIQDERDHVQVLVVPNAGHGKDELRELVDGVAKVLGPEMRIDLTLVDEIPTLPSGKMRSIWNKVSS